MRKRSFATLGLLALLAAVSAFGQKLTADIPFEFHLSDKVMPAGHYGVTLDSNGVQGLLSVDSSIGSARGFALTYNIGGDEYAHNEGRLVFKKYGDTYFLSEAWSPDRTQGTSLLETKTERELARNIQPSETGQVLVALR